MDSSLLKVLGQVAGIGGISLGVLLLIFRDVVRRKIFPQLAQAQAYKLIRLVVVLTFSIALVGIAAWAFVNARVPGPEPAAQAALWTKNWYSVNESIPWMGSSEGYSATNRERLLTQLRALDLPASPGLAGARDELLAMVRDATARQGDPTYNMIVPPGFDDRYASLKRAIRDRAIEVGVDLRTGGR